jgi:peptidoglycan-associated lipoprotein
VDKKETKMQFSKITKGLLIAIPALMLTACGSSSVVNDESKAATTNQSTDAPQASAMGQNASAVEVNTVDTVDEVQTVEEMQQAKFDALRQEQTVYFDFDDSKVDAKYLELLQAHADYLIKNPNQTVMVEGHCDERGTPEYNIALGERRAKAVSQYLQNLGVLQSQISTVSYGEEKPLDLSRTQEGFAKNRRAVLVY